MSELIFIVGFCLFIGMFMYLMTPYDKMYSASLDKEAYNYIIQNLDKATLTTQYNQICINDVYISVYDTIVYIDGSYIVCNYDTSPITNKIKSLQMTQNKLWNQKICTKLKGETCQS